MYLSTATSVLVNYTLEGAVEQVIQAGLGGIDLWCGRPHLFRRDHSAEKLMALRQRMEAARLTVASVMPAFFRYPFSLSSPVEEIRLDSIRYMHDCIDNAVLVGAQHVLVVPANLLVGQTLADARSRFLASLANVCDYAEAAHMKLGIEVIQPGLSAYMCHTRQAMELIRELQSDAVGVVLDSGHLNLSGESFAAALETVGDALLQVHVNDNNGREQQNAIPGEGSFDFSAMLERLRCANYRGSLALELGWHYSTDPVSALRTAMERMNGYLAVRH